MANITDYTQVMNRRADFYYFLRDFYYVEITKEQYNDLKKMSFPKNCGQSDMQAGYDMLTDFLAKNDDSIVDELAADFAKVFLAAGEYDGNGAFPYESVYTSPKKLVMQDAWEKVKAVYTAHGLALDDVPSEIHEDHIAMELQYMAWLCEQSAKIANDSLVADQQDFLENHMLNWIPKFCDDIEKHANLDFYKAAAKITRGFLEMEADGIKNALSGTEEAVGSYELDGASFDRILGRLKENYRVYAPKVSGKKGAKGEDVIRFGEIDSISDIAIQHQSDFSAKEVYYPVMQTMMYFTEDTSEESAVLEDRGIIIFAHPCDINAVRRLDNIFLNNGGSADIYYARLRNKVKFVLLQCRESYEHCSCVSLGSNETSDYCMAIDLTGDGCRVQVKETFLLSLFDGVKECDYSPEFIQKNEKPINVPGIKGKEDVKKASELAFWSEYDEDCISCGGCNTVCPTCSCFDTIDVIYDENSRDGERRRVWSSCMLETFTETAGGARARKTPGANMRFKVLHKMYDYNSRFDAGENMCVGCGRCTIRCPKDIDYREAVNRLAEEMAK